MDLDLKDKVFAIVGGTAGMGFAAAEILVEEGAQVGLIGRNGAHGAAKVEQLKTAVPGCRAKAYVADGTCRGDLESGLAAVVADFGTLDGLVVTAGPMQKTVIFTELTDDDWELYFQTQLMTTVRACRAALPYLEKSKGSVVVTAAYSVRAQKPTLSAYSALKCGVAAISKNIAKNWGDKGVRCNCICPGAIATDAMDGLRAMALEKYGHELSPDEALDRYFFEEWPMDIALQRLGKPREVGELIAFLLSSRAAYMTGALINIDGGTDF